MTCGGLALCGLLLLELIRGDIEDGVGGPRALSGLLLRRTNCNEMQGSDLLRGREL